MAEYDAIFRALFLGHSIQAPAEGEDDDEVEAYEPTGEVQSMDAPEDESDVGAEAVAAERLGQRDLTDGDDAALVRLRREATRALPRRTSYRRRSVRKGDRLDMRRTLRDAARREGDVLRLWETKRKERQRRLLLLIDVSGSMKDRSEELLRLAHAIVQSADRAEVFTLSLIHI